MLRRAARYAKPYRRTTRRTAKRYLKTRRSFISLSARARMDPVGKRRKFNAISSQNDDDPAVSENPAQSGLSAIAPLNMVRFKDPASDVFDYHHFVRRLNVGFISTAAGAAGTSGYLAIATTFRAIPDQAELSALYGRFRMTRFVFEFVPTFVPGISAAGTFAPLIYTDVFRAGFEDPSNSETKMLNNPRSVRNNYGYFQISCTPNAVKEVKMDDVAHAAITDSTITLAPWIDSTTGLDIEHYGAEVLVVNTNIVAQSYSIYSVILTVYFDMDSNAF